MSDFKIVAPGDIKKFSAEINKCEICRKPRSIRGIHVKCSKIKQKLSKKARGER